MRGGTRENAGRKKGEVAYKIPEIEIDAEAIAEIKRQKKGVYKRYSRQSKQKEK